MGGCFEGRFWLYRGGEGNSKNMKAGRICEGCGSGIDSSKADGSTIVLSLILKDSDFIHYVYVDELEIAVINCWGAIS